jgi:tryptophan synthase beta chain
VAASDAEALEAFEILAHSEGIIPALESAHAIAHTLKMARGDAAGKTIVVNLSGRGDKDVAQVRDIVRGSA